MPDALHALPVDPLPFLYQQGVDEAVPTSWMQEGQFTDPLRQGAVLTGFGTVVPGRLGEPRQEAGPLCSDAGGDQLLHN